jgi:hypothetical protein
MAASCMKLAHAMNYMSFGEALFAILHVGLWRLSLNPSLPVCLFMATSQEKAYSCSRRF